MGCNRGIGFYLTQKLLKDINNIVIGTTRLDTKSKKYSTNNYSQYENRYSFNLLMQFLYALTNSCSRNVKVNG